MDSLILQDSFSPYMHLIAKERPLYDVIYNVKNSYGQTALGVSGIIGGRYPLCLDLCARIRTERDAIRNGAIASQQAHRTELEDARSAAEDLQAETKAAKKAALATKGSKGKKNVRFNFPRIVPSSVSDCFLSQNTSPRQPSTTPTMKSPSSTTQSSQPCLVLVRRTTRCNLTLRWYVSEMLRECLSAIDELHAAFLRMQVGVRSLLCLPPYVAR